MPERRGGLRSGGVATRVVAPVLGAFALAVLIGSGRIRTTDLLAYGALVVSVLLHEQAHAWAAGLLGDRGAIEAGRRLRSLWRGVDPLGTLIVPALVILGGFGFVGWARPVQVDEHRLRRGARSAEIVALAGPATSAALVLGSCLAFRLTAAPWPAALSLPARTFFLLGLANIWLTFIYLLPVPPLDGAMVLERHLPSAAWPRYLRIRPYALLGLLGFCLLDISLGLGILRWINDEILNWWIGLTGA